jgi:hypothetical protein
MSPNSNSLISALRGDTRCADETIGRFSVVAVAVLWGMVVPFAVINASLDEAGL